jgi:hypothetical protein
MSDQRIRPVSGEIIIREGDAAQQLKAGVVVDDIVDAEFETLRPDPADRLAAPIRHTAIGTVEAPSIGLGTLRRSEAGPPQPAARGGPLFWIVGLGLAVGAFWVSGGHELVRQTALMPPAPQARPANPLRIADVASRIEDHGGRSILFVDGKAVNDGSEEMLLPSIEIKVTANGGDVLRYKLGTSAKPLAGGGEFSFSSRFEAPKEGIKSVSVAFQDS